MGVFAHIPADIGSLMHMVFCNKKIKTVKAAQEFRSGETLAVPVNLRVSSNLIFILNLTTGFNGLG